MTYRPPRSEHLDRYVRFVRDRRRLEAARARGSRWERSARLAAALVVAWLVLVAAELARGGMGWRDYLTVAALGWLAISEWRKARRRAKRARRLVAKRAARLK